MYLLTSYSFQLIGMFCLETRAWQCLTYSYMYFEFVKLYELCDFFGHQTFLFWTGLYLILLTDCTIKHNLSIIPNVSRTVKLVG